jgi:hypothetical protein
MLLLNDVFIYSHNLALVEIIFIRLIFNRTNNFLSFLCLEQACAKKEYVLNISTVTQFVVQGGGTHSWVTSILSILQYFSNSHMNYFEYPI